MYLFIINFLTQVNNKNYKNQNNKKFMNIEVWWKFVYKVMVI